jgi:hypothetical protein
MVTGTLILQRMGICLALSGLTPISFPTFLKHSHRALRTSLVTACLNTFCAPTQQAAVGGSGSGLELTKNDWHGNKAITASLHDMSSEGLPLTFRTKDINPKAITAKPINIFFSILF